MRWAGLWPSISESCACSAASLAEVSTPSSVWPLCPSPPEDPTLSSLSWGALSSVYPQQGLGKRTEEGVWEAPSSASAPPVLSAMIRGAADGCRFQVWDYEVGEVEVMLDRYFAAYPPEQVASSLDPTT